MADKPNDDQLAAAMNAAAGPSAPVPVKAMTPPVSRSTTTAKPAIGNLAAGLNPSIRRQATKQVVVNDEFECDVAFNMAFIGAGQGGGRIANAFHSLGYRRIAAFNTTDSDFKGLHADVQTHALDVGGAAKDTEQARKALLGREEEVWDLMTRAWGNEVDYALVCVGLGGGTGSGTAAQLVESARAYLEDKGRPVRVGAIVSLPTVSEGQKVCSNALHSLRRLLELQVSPLLIIDNAKINEIYRPGMAELHKTANDTVSQLFHLFNQLAAVHSDYITFDRAELAQLLDNGIVVLGSANVGDINTITSPADVSKAIREELANNVLAQVDLKLGQVGACLFVGNETELQALSLDYFEAGFSQLDRTLGTARSPDEAITPILHRGLYLGSAPGLQVYTMIGGLKPPMARLAELAKKAGFQQTRPGAAGGIASFFGIQD